MVVAKLLKEGIVVRGLGHPVIFQSPGRGELDGRIPGLVPTEPSGGGGVQFTGNAGNFRAFGAVPVSPRNFYRVLEAGQNALLFPGGVREVFHGKNEAYQLFWPEKVDFVRTAARFNATIIPLSSVGMADSVNMLLDSGEVAKLPFIGESAKLFAANVPSARFDTANQDEFFLPPISAPSLPARNYFVFGKPMSTKDLDPKDKEACKRAYLAIQEETKRGISDILEARENDPYKNTPRRLAFERFTGNKAPTFSMEEINR